MTRQVLVVKRFRFEAAHLLPNHQNSLGNPGKCSRLHGHSYVLEVGLRGPVIEADGSSSEGMVIDFAKVSGIVKRTIISKVDHFCLNDVLPLSYLPSTAENIARWVYDMLDPAFDQYAAQLSFVRVWETATSYAQVGDAGPGASTLSVAD